MEFKKGIKDSIPVGLGYFAISFSLGIIAKNVGLSPIQGFLTSLFINASAGEYAVFLMISTHGTFIQMIIMTLVSNARYFLMSFALSQKIEEKTTLVHRMCIGFDLTDELFGLVINHKGKVKYKYIYGTYLVALPCWAFGTALGIIAGSLDLGFTCIDAIQQVQYQELYYDEMFALVPQNHVLAKYNVLSMKQIAKYPFIQLDEGEYSLPINMFHSLNLPVQIKHKVYDDSTILAMIRQNLGISILYQNALSDYDDLCLIPIQENLFCHVGIAYNNYDTLSYAGKTFLDFILKKTPEILKDKDSFHIIKI